ncbi:MAG TPA: glycosyltransferase [Pyrinomonadaceae bacterium]|nr:glycosyltransferase [Pyrinomonadaceae bacterium]
MPTPTGEPENVSLPSAARRLLSSLRRHPPDLRRLGPKVLRAWRASGWRGFKLWADDRLREYRDRTAYREWVERHDTLTDADRRRIAELSEALPRKPLISVLMPVYNVDEVWLRLALESVLRQLYTRWELCVADDRSTKPHVRRVLEEYAARDERVRVVFREENGHISRASNSALEMARGEYVALLDHDDELAEHALYLVAREINAHPEADLIYSDEDIIEDGARVAPFFKPDWSPDFFLSLNMISHLGVYRTSLVRDIGGFREGYEGSQDYDLALRVTERVPASHVRHIPHILYHWRRIPGSVALGAGEKEYAHSAARRAIASHLERRGVGAEAADGPGVLHRVVYPVPSPPPLVSLILAAQGGEAVEALLARTDYEAVEVLLIDEATPALMNAAAAGARGELLCVMAEPLRPADGGWLWEMAGQALRHEIGVVGAKILRPDDTIGHAGLILGAGGVAAPAHEGFLGRSFGHNARTRVTQNFSAVSGACLVTRRAVFDEAGGFDASGLPRLYWDVDFCLRVRARGYRVLWTPYAELYETRALNRTAAPPEGPEAARIKGRWGDLLADDPYYNPNLSLERADFAVAVPPRFEKPWA